MVWYCPRVPDQFSDCWTPVHCTCCSNKLCACYALTVIHMDPWSPTPVPLQIAHLSEHSVQRVPARPAYACRHSMVSFMPAFPLTPTNPCFRLYHLRAPFRILPCFLLLKVCDHFDLPLISLFLFFPYLISPFILSHLIGLSMPLSLLLSYL
jgi:hypothetical protein